GDIAHCRGGRDRLPSHRLSRRTGLGLDADGRGRRARGLCREDTAVPRAPMLCPSRHSAGGGGHTSHAQGIASWPLSVALLVVAAICMMTATAWYLRLAHGWDALSALLGASPGSMAQVMALSAEFDADVRGIAIVHVMRVLLIVLGLPAGLALF